MSIHYDHVQGMSKKLRLFQNKYSEIRRKYLILVMIYHNYFFIVNDHISESKKGIFKETNRIEWLPSIPPAFFMFETSAAFYKNPLEI